jgi:hypothetical protein
MRDMSLWRGIGLARLAAAAVAVLAFGAGGSARAAGGLSWSSPVLVDHHGPFSARRSFAAVSCPSVSLCVSVETGGRVLTWKNPSSAASVWRTSDIDRAYGTFGAGELLDVSCPSMSLCVAVDSAGDVLSSTQPARRAAHWSLRRVDPGHELSGISCASESLCVAVDGAGNALTSRDPAGQASSWRVKRVDRGKGAASGYLAPRLIAVSCPSVRLCVGLDRVGSIVTSRSPAAARANWRFTRLDDPGASSPLFPGGAAGGISCTPSSSCVIASGLDLVTSTDPVGGAKAWVTSRVESLPQSFTAVRCASSSLCLAVDTAGDMIAFPRPTDSASAWRASLIDPSSIHDGGLTGVACPSARLCVAVDHAGNVLNASRPAAGASAWMLRDLRQGYNTLVSLSCPTVSLCVGYDSAGNLVVSEHPVARRAAWKVFRVGRAGVSSLSCVRSSVCFGLDTAGNVLSSANPAAGARSWTITRVDPADKPSAISCASVSLCIVVESNGEAATSINPTGGSSAWSVAHVDTASGFECGKYGPGVDCDPQLESVSCPSTSFCAASDANGNVITSTNPAGGSDAWHLTRVDDPPTFGYITCPSAPAVREVFQLLRQRCCLTRSRRERRRLADHTDRRQLLRTIGYHLSFGHIVHRIRQRRQRDHLEEPDCRFVLLEDREHRPRQRPFGRLLSRRHVHRA